MNNEKIDLQTRMSAAGVLMPFCYPKLSAQAVVSTRIDAVEPGVLIRTINERLSKIANGGTLVRQDPAETQGKTPVSADCTVSAHTAAHIQQSGSAA